jgi:hypothetical protein
MIITNKKLDNPTKRNEHTHPKVGMSSTMVTLVIPSIDLFRKCGISSTKNSVLNHPN